MQDALSDKIYIQYFPEAKLNHFLSSTLEKNRTKWMLSAKAFEQKTFVGQLAFLYSYNMQN